MMNNLEKSKNEEGGQITNNCFVCGSTNPIGLKVKFSLVDGVCIALFTPQVQHAGYESVTHGGILFSLLDDVMANWVWLQGEKCFTAKADIRYRAELPIGKEVRLEGRCLKRKGRLAQMEGKIIRTDNQFVVAQASASFMTEAS
tara:strand:- start:185 stop:616 length:432 start_codon:yes stop_codon:yes gene_type:complete